jgi:CRP/FNR family transcriptional regulator, dissimilatory nitrate respiration regulator
MSTQPKYQLDIPGLLGRLPLFQEISPAQMEHIASQVREKRLAKGEMLFQKGDSPSGMFSVVFGQIKLAFPSSSGNEKVVDILGPSQLFGEGVMFMDRPYPVFAEAIADSLLLHIPKILLFELLESDPTFARQMLAGMSMRLHSLIQDVESYSLRSSAQRVIGYLLQHCPTEGKSELADGIAITLPTSKQIIASRLNLTPETLSRIFHDLAVANLISVDGKQITIHSLRQLQEFDL